MNLKPRDRITNEHPDQHQGWMLSWGQNHKSGFFFLFLAFPRADPSLGQIPLDAASAGCQGSPAALQGGFYLLVDVAHSQVLLVAGAGHSDVLQPVASPALARVTAELLSAQGIGNLRENGTGEGSQAGKGFAGHNSKQEIERRKGRDVADKGIYDKDGISSQLLSGDPGWQNLQGHT